MAQNALRQIERRRDQLLVCHHAIDQADLIRALRRERVSGEEKLQSPLSPGEARQALCSSERGGIPILISGLANDARSLATAK